MRKTLLIILILFTFFTPYNYASIEIRSKRITTSEGLANNTVRYFYQDSKGFIWMATLDGLSRYDGNSFITFRPEQNNPLSLVDHRVYDMIEDQNGFLWISTSPELYSCYDLKRACFVDFTGKGEFRENYAKMVIAGNGDVWLWHVGNGARRVRYNPVTNSFSSVAYKTILNNIPHNNVQFVYEDTSGTIWIGTQQGLVRVTPDGQEKVIDTRYNYFGVTAYGDDVYFLTNNREIFVYDAPTGSLVKKTDIQGAGPNTIFSGSFLLGNEWVLLTSEGVFVYNFADNNAGKDFRLFGRDIRNGEVTLDNKGNYWVFNLSGNTWYVDRVNGTVKSFSLIPADKVGYVDSERYHVVHDSRNIIWISTYGNGLFAYDTVNDELEHISSDISGFSHITSDFLQTVMEDRSGNIWVSSEYSGVSRITILNEGSIRIFPEDHNLLDRSNTVRTIAKLDDDDIWIATRKGGLYHYNSRLEMKSPKSFYHSNIYAIVKDDQQKVWVGSRGDGLLVDNVRYRNEITDPFSIANNNIFAIHQDRKGRMWIGTFGGGLQLAIEEDGKYIFKNFFDQSYGQRQVRTITEDKNGYIWFGTSSGVFAFDPDSLIVDPRNYYAYNTGNGRLLSNEIRAIIKDDQDRMWLGTSGSGFSLGVIDGDYSKLTFKHYTTTEGLCNNVTQSFAQDFDGNLWVGTEYGISKFYPDTEVFENYYFSNYALGNVYTENCATRLSNGHLLFGTNYGLVVIEPGQIMQSPFVATPVITNLRVNGIDMQPGDPGSPLKESISYSSDIELSYYQNSLIFDFSTFNYSDLRQIKYSYKLDNYDNKWSAPDALNFASYKNLPSGKYTLRVKSCDSSGIWNEEECRLFITITPPWWATWWASLIYACMVCAAVWFAFKVTRNFTRLHNRIVVEKQLTEYKLVFFTNISHEFRTPLTLIQGALEKIQRHRDLPQDVYSSLRKMDKNSKRMLRLIDQLLEFRKMQNNKLALSLEETDIVGFLYEIFLSFGDIAESKSMDFQFRPSVASYKMYIDKGKVDKILYNLVSNAFKYTPSSGKINLALVVNEERNMLQIVVSDTGVGIPKEKRSELFKRFMQSSFSSQSVGVGLHLTHELVSVHKGLIDFSENEGGGSVFTVTLPLGIEEYQESDFLIPTSLMKEEKRMGVIETLSEEEEEILDKTPLNKHKVLIIEDNNEVREFLRDEIGGYFTVEVAEDGQQGLDMAKEVEPDLIVCDIMMPKLNGYEVTKRLKADFKTSHIPVILLTALSSPENHLEGIESGADAYIAKPFSVKLLLARILKLIEQREKLREKFSSEPGVIRPAICSTDRDKEFVDKLHQVLDKELVNPEFSVDEFASQMGLGRTVFYKKVRGVTGYSPNEYIRIIRMKRAAELLLSTNLTVAEVSYKVGINDPFYFSKCFKGQFGIAPSVYQKGEVKEEEGVKK